MAPGDGSRAAPIGNDAGPLSLRGRYSPDRHPFAPTPARNPDRGCARGYAAPTAWSCTTFLLAAIAACCSIQSAIFCTSGCSQSRHVRSR